MANPPTPLQAALDALHWSQRTLAAVVGRQPTTVRRWATGEANTPAWVMTGLERLVAFRKANPIKPD